MSRILVESANLLYSVMMQLKEKTNKDLEKIVDSLGEFFHSSLLKAVEDVGETAALRVLVQLKLDPNVEYHSTHGEAGTKATPLYIACQLGHTEAVRLLLLNQADPNIRSSDNKKTPLMVACSNKHAEVVKLLLAHRAIDVEALDEDHDTALRYANDRNNTEIVRLLLEAAHANPNVYGKNDWSCLLVSCCEGYLDNVVLLLEHGADPYHKVKGGKTCLMMASQNGHIDIVRLLLNSKRVDIKKLINEQTEEGWTALALAYDKPQIVKLLLEHDADPNLHTNDGWTPLILACQKEGIPTTVELLLNPKYQVDIEHENDFGVSAYGLASFNKLKDIMELLDKAGAKERWLVSDMAKSLIRLKPVLSLIRKLGSKTESLPVISEEPHVGESLPRSAGAAIATDGMGEEMQQPKQEQGQADEVLKANHKQLQLTIKEIKREMEGLGDITFTFESSTLEARGKLAKIQEKIRYVKEVVLLEGVGTEEGGSTGSLFTAAEVIDAYDVSLRTTQRTLEAAQHKAAISKKECTELENKIKEMEKKMAVLKDNNEQQADKLEILQHKAAVAKLADEVEVQVDTLSDVIQDYKERLQASEEKVQSKQKMEHARDAQISNLKTTQELEEKRYNESLIASKAEKQHLLQVLELRQKMERARDAQILRLKTSNKVLQKKCDELMADDDDKQQQLLNYVIQVCRPKDWQISLLEDRLAKRQLAISSSHSQKRLDSVLKEEFTLDQVYEEVKEITNPHEIAYVLIQDSKKLREIWVQNADELTPEERTKLAIHHWMTTHPKASWMLLAKHIEWYIHGEHKAVAHRIAATIRKKYLSKVEEKIGFGPPKDSEKRKFPKTFNATDAFQQMTTVEDWFGLGWFLEIEEEQLQQIEKEHGCDDDRKLAMLKLWEELNPKSASWNSLTTAVRKMPQHQSLADDIQENFLAQSANVVDKHVFKLEGSKAQPLLWKGHAFRIFIPEDALLPYETCHVSVKAIVGGRFQFPEGTEPVSAVYGISLSRQLRKPARMEMQHCVKLENAKHSKLMSFAVASHDPSTMSYQFHEVPGGSFEENKSFGSINRQQFCLMTITIKSMCARDINFVYSASTLTQKVNIEEQLWILAVSKNLDTMKQYLTSSLTEAEQEIEDITFEFENEELTLEILDQATPGWTINTLRTPCKITRRQVELRIQLRKVRVAFERPSIPPQEVLRNRIQLNGIKPECCLNIHFNPSMPRTGCQLSDQLSRERLSSQNSSTASATSERSNSLSVTSPTSPWPTSPISDEAVRIGTPTTTSSSSTASATVTDRTEGTTSRHNSDSTSQSQAQTSPTTTAAHEEIATGGQIRGVGESDQQTLTISDLRDVLHQLSNLTPSNYNMLGLELGLLAPTLNQLKSTHSSEDFGLHVMEAWLNQVDEVNPTWECLIAALQSPIVKQNATAQQLRQWLKSR